MSIFYLYLHAWAYYLSYLAGNLSVFLKYYLTSANAFNLDARLIVTSLLALELHVYGWSHLRCIFLYACAEPLFYLFSWQHSCAKFLFAIFRFCSHSTIIYSLGLIFCSQRDMHLFAKVHTFKFYKKIQRKIKFSKYSQVWSCFEDLDARNTMLQSKFNLDICCGIYGFFLSQTCLHVGDVIVLSFLHACIYTFSPCNNK